MNELRLRRWHVITMLVGFMFLSVIHLFLLFLVVSLLPIHPYKAYCPGNRTFIEGPYRERFIVLLLWSFKTNGVYYIHYKSTVYAPAFLDQRNSDWRLASDIVAGFEVDDTFFAPPDRVVRLLNERGYANDGSLGVKLVDDCELFRAAILPDEAFGEPAPKPWTNVTIH